jgi:hypothetical protein
MKIIKSRFVNEEKERCGVFIYYRLSFFFFSFIKNNGYVKEERPSLTTKSEIFKYTKKWVLLKKVVGRKVDNNRSQNDYENNKDEGGVLNDGRSRGLSPTGFQ